MNPEDDLLPGETATAPAETAVETASEETADEAAPVEGD